MKSILLQVPSPEATFLSKLVDQSFVIILLSVIAWLLWKRITKVQDRMDAYLSEDRKEMSEVIKNNTTVMQGVTEILNELKFSKK